MRVIGIDLDNTIVQYDQIIHTLAVQRGLIPVNTQPNKTIIRDIIRSRGQEHLWIDIQGYIYGEGMQSAQPFPGVIRFIQSCRKLAIPVYIISHRSKNPYAGGGADLHDSAMKWLVQEGITGHSDIMVAEERIFFELTKEEKYNRIRSSGCSFFIDDLIEFLVSDQFPKEVIPVLFDPYNNYPDNSVYRRIKSWNDLPILVPMV